MAGSLLGQEGGRSQRRNCDGGSRVQSDATAGSEGGGGAMSQWRQPLEGKKRLGNGVSPELLEGRQSGWSLEFSPEKPVWDF